MPKLSLSQLERHLFAATFPPGLHLVDLSRLDPVQAVIMDDEQERAVVGYIKSLACSLANSPTR